jgi:hypothetical protein
MMVTYNAANEIDWFRPERRRRKGAHDPCLGIPLHRFQTLPHLQVPYHLARVVALSGERRKILFKDNQKRQEDPRFQGNSFAGFYLTTIGRF